jgi:hypothetical protein
MICRHAGSLLLNERGSFITALPEREVDQAEWQAAIKALILVAELGGATMFARIGVMQALNHGQVRELRETGKKHHWGRRKLERDSLIHILDLKADQLRTRRALPRTLPCSPRRNAEATFDLA